MYIHDDDKPPLVPYIIASLVVHILLLVLFPYHIESSSWKEKVVEIFPVIEKSSMPYEIADIAKPAVERQPKKARFLGMYNSSVGEETVAISRKKGSEGRGTKDEGRKRLIGKNEGVERTTHDARRTTNLYNVGRKLFAMKTPDIESKGAEAGGATEALADYYPDYRLGTHTYLNVLRYPDIEYFVRMKRQFKMTFNPVPVLRNHFATNRVTRGSIEVVLAVSVNRDGNLSELFVINGSGIPTYDHEAMRTIRASAPFATPPDKFLEDDGLLRMSWTFTVYL